MESIYYPFGFIVSVSMSYTISGADVVVIWAAENCYVTYLTAEEVPTIPLTYGLYLSTLPTAIVFPSSRSVNLPIC